MKYLSSLTFGLAALVWLHLSYLLLFDTLYWSFAVAPKVSFCRQYLEGEACNLVAYISLWLMELPLLSVSFLCLSLLVFVPFNLYEKLRIKSYLVVFSYVAGVFLYVLFGPYAGNHLFTLFSSLYQASILLLCIFLVRHLTSGLRRGTAQSAAP